jgi:LuxR family quorum-sensing system transcriptional regulator SolR
MLGVIDRRTQGIVMRDRRDDPFQALVHVSCERAVFDTLVSLARQLDFEFCAYGLCLPTPCSRPTTISISNYPSDWQARYREQGYFYVDPTVQHCLRSVAPVTWTDELFASTPQLRAEARAHGLTHGWTQSSRSVDGATGMLSLARSQTPLSPDEVEEKRFRMTWLAHVAHSEMSRRLIAKIMPGSGARLTPREIEVLRWTADGKTASEICSILNISKSTVAFHISNAMDKLEVTNKTAASVRAAVLGLFY